MGNLTIKLRISAYMAAIAVLFAAFMVAFFPPQASKMGNRLMADSAVTIASLFAANIEPAYDALGFGGEEIISTALHNLSGDTARAGSEAHVDGKQAVSAPIEIHRVTVYNDQGARLDGYGDAAHAREAVEPQRALRLENLDDE